jgi:hypothetical protein
MSRYFGLLNDALIWLMLIGLILVLGWGFRCSLGSFG